MIYNDAFANYVGEVTSLNAAFMAVQQYKFHNPYAQGAVMYMNNETANRILRDPEIKTFAGHPVDLLFGFPVVIDDNLPDNKIMIESARQRELREMREAGIKVLVSEPIDWSKTAPEPTLKALLKHWWNKLKRRNK